MDYKIWVGKYESEIIDKDLFSYSITLYGSNCNNNYAYFEETGMGIFKYDDFLNFIINKIKLIILNKSNYKVYFYNEKWGYDILQKTPNLKDLLVLGNKVHILDFLNNKIYSRNWLCNKVRIPQFFLGTREDCRYQDLLRYFEGFDSFIIQEVISEGGEGTFILKSDNNDIYYKLKDNNTYLIAPFYLHAFSLNITIIFSKKNYICFPISEQIFDEKYRFIGSDFISGNEIYTSHKNIIIEFVNSIAKLLQNNHYIGLCGIDFIISNDNVYFVEFNPRFQGSTFLLNSFLYKEKHLTIQELYLDVLNGKEFDKSLEDITELKIGQSWSFNKNTNINAANIITDGIKAAANKYIYLNKISTSIIEHLTNSYYDYFATRYKYIMSEYDYKIESEGRLLSKLFDQYSNRLVHSVLDCTCGIGVQTMSLAQIGYEVYGSDISAGEIEVAKSESKKRNLNIIYKISDCRYLDKTFRRKFDAIISIDSALTHLLDENSMYHALRSIYERLEYGGIFIASFRDYDEMIIKKPEWAYPTRYRKTETGYAIILRHLDWDDDKCTSSQFYIEVENQKAPKLLYNTYKQWAITREKLLSISQRLPFSKAFWLFPDETGFYQPIFCAIK